MLRAMFSAASGMTAQQMNVDNIANNLANASTWASNRGAPSSRTCCIRPCAARSGRQPTDPCAHGMQLGLGTRAASNEIIFTQGAFETDNPLDLVIQGNGFFQVRRHRATAYTRDGRSTWTQRQRGHRRAATRWSRRSRSRPTHSITIAPDGTVSYTLPNQTAAQQVGQIQTRQFPEPVGPEQPGGQPVQPPRTPRARPVVDVPGGQRGLGSRHAGLCRAVQRIGSGRVHQPDRCPARL